MARAAAGEMMRRLFLAAAVALLAAPAHAADVKSLPAVKGAETWFVEDHTVPMIAMEVSIPAGSAYDPAGKFGLSAFAGEMLDEGAGNLNAKAYHEALADKAIQLTVTPDRDYLEITLTTLSENAADAFKLLGLALQHPRFDGDAVARVKAQLLQALAQEDQDPTNIADKGFYAAFFAGHPYAHPADGDAPGLSAVTAADLKAFAHAYWVRGGMKIAISGDASAATATALLQSAFGALPGNTPPPPPSLPHRQRAGQKVITMAVPQAVAAFGLPGVARTDKDFVPAYVANYIVGGGGFSSRLTNEVRVKRGLTYGISTALLTLRRASFLDGQVATRVDSMSQSIAVMRQVLQDFADNGPTDQELADAKTYLTGSFPLTFASNSGTVAQLAIFQRQGLGPDYVAKRNGLIAAVTIDDVRRAAKRLFDPARLTIVVAGSLGDSGRAGGH
jgi:zinc protease